MGLKLHKEELIQCEAWYFNEISRESDGVACIEIYIAYFEYNE